MPTARVSIVFLSVCFVAVSQLASACTVRDGDDEESDDATSESAWTQATPLEAKMERALALGVARGASESLLARPISQGGVGLTAAAAKSIRAYSLGADGTPGTADDGKLETYTDLDALPSVGVATIQRIRDFAWKAQLVQPSLPEEQRLTGMTARGLFTALNPGSATLSCKTSSRYSVRSVAWNSVSGCEPREDAGNSSVTLTYSLVETGGPIGFDFVGDDPSKPAGFYDVRGLAIRVAVPPDSRSYELVDVSFVINGASRGMGTLKTVSAGYLDLQTTHSGSVSIGVSGDSLAITLTRSKSYVRLNDCGGGFSSESCEGRTR